MSAFWVCNSQDVGIAVISNQMSRKLVCVLAATSTERPKFCQRDLDALKTQKSPDKLSVDGQASELVV